MLTIGQRQFWDIVLTKLRLNLRSEVSKTYLGYLWWLLEPALFVAALYVVFGIFLKTRTDNLTVFLAVGMVTFSWFARSVSNGSRSLDTAGSLTNQVAVPKLLFPLVVVSQDFVKQTLVFVALFLFLFFMGFKMTHVWLSLPFLIITQWLLILAVAMVFAGIVPFLPDFRYLVSTGLTILMWGSGIFYSYEDVIIAKHQDLFLLNPMARLIKNYRQVLMDGNWPDWGALGLIALFAMVVIVSMLWVYKKLDTTYARLALQ